MKTDTIFLLFERKSTLGDNIIYFYLFHILSKFSHEFFFLTILYIADLPAEMFARDRRNALDRWLKNLLARDRRHKCARAFAIPLVRGDICEIGMCPIAWA